MSFCSLADIVIHEGIIVDELERDARPPMPFLEATYVITPCESSIEILFNDFSLSEKPKYQGAQVFFTHACPPHLFNLLEEHPARKFVKILKEIDISFVAYEPQVFTLDRRFTIGFPYSNGECDGDHNADLVRIAAQVSTLCTALGDYPRIRYRALNARLAELVSESLGSSVVEDGSDSFGSLLLILDRAFDCVFSLLHEVTLQAMAYDILPLRNDYDRYKANHLKRGELKEDVFHEAGNKIWVCHRKISEAVSYIANKGLFVDFPKVKVTIRVSLTDERQTVKNSCQKRFDLQLPREPRFGHHRVIDACVGMYERKIQKLFKLEQKLIQCSDFDGEKLRDLESRIDSILVDPSLSDYDKIRIVLLHC